MVCSSGRHIKNKDRGSARGVCVSDTGEGLTQGLVGN
jgi:hypothetical protein